MEQLKLTDFLEYKFLSAVQYAPGGERAAFVVKKCNEQDNCYESTLWLWEGGKLRQLTSMGKESSFVWEDESHLLFPAVRSSAEKKRAEAKEQFTSYYRLDVHGGEALPAFTLPFAAMGIKHWKDDLWLAVGGLDLTAPDYASMTAEEKTEVAKRQEGEQDYEVFDELPFWFNGMGVVNGQRSALFLCDVAADTCRRLMAPAFDLTDVKILKDTVYFTGAEHTGYDDRRKFGLYCLKNEQAEPVLLKEHELYGGSLEVVGEQLLLLGTEGKRYGLNENEWVYKVDAATGELTVLRKEEYSMYSSVGSDCRNGGGRPRAAKGDKLYHTTTREGDSHLYALTMTGESIPVITKAGSVDSFAVCNESDTALLVAMYDGRLQELYTADLATGTVEQVSHFNTKVLEGKYVAEPQPLTIESEGLRIGGWVLLPKDYDPEKTYPAVFDIHGGPKTVYGPVFYHEMQLWANMGYFVFFCNPKGSDGRDNEFMDIRGHYGETDYKNLMDFADAVLAKYPQIDPARVCETGGSYGGFMTNWIIGHTDRFCCAASQRSIANWVSFYGVSDIGVDFAMDQCAGDPFTEVEALWQQSPLRYAANAKTPTLFIHSDEDYRCPMAEGLQMYTSLMVHGVPTRLCLFHGENHELSRGGKPKHRVRRLTEITDWFEKYSRIKQ